MDDKIDQASTKIENKSSLRFRSVLGGPLDAKSVKRYFGGGGTIFGPAFQKNEKIAFEKASKHWFNKHVDILCIQESKIPLNSFFRYKDFICISSTDIQGGEKTAKNNPGLKVTKSNPSENEPPTATGTGINSHQKPKATMQYGVFQAPCQ